MLRCHVPPRVMMKEPQRKSKLTSTYKTRSKSGVSLPGDASEKRKLDLQIIEEGKRNLVEF